ncbi:MAG TPA: hypothetical protein VGP90_11920, partial [Acidimicrobiia bacterium]|nr:hypothetical protein [Acidimicrobiia bacterium]
MAGSHARLVGFMCPRGELGRPALAALADRTATSWVGDTAALRRVLASGRPTELAVLGFDGRRTGWFTPAGLVEGKLSAATAIGAYAGALPCADEATANACEAATGGCGLAVGAPDGDDPTPAPGTGACVVGQSLVVDTDGDGRSEAFSLATLGALGEEIT